MEESKYEFSINFLKNELMIHIHAACRKLRRADCKCGTIGVIVKKDSEYSIVLKQFINLIS